MTPFTKDHSVDLPRILPVPQNQPRQVPPTPLPHYGFTLPLCVCSCPRPHRWYMGQVFQILPVRAKSQQLLISTGLLSVTHKAANSRQLRDSDAFDSHGHFFVILKWSGQAEAVTMPYQRVPLKGKRNCRCLKIVCLAQKNQELFLWNIKFTLSFNGSSS